MSAGVDSGNLRRAIGMGLMAAAFFSVSFVLSRQMAEAEGHWAWSSALRFLLMLPLLGGLILFQGKAGELWRMWKRSPWGWVVWGTVGCGIFYTTLVAACVVSPGWVVAGSWPVAIVIGILLGPWLYRDHRRKIPRRALWNSVLIVLGVMLLQVGQVGEMKWEDVLLGLGLVLVSATAHPVGNRMSLQLLEGGTERPDAVLRLTAMTLGSLPFFLLLVVWGYWQAGWPASGQWVGSGVVALCGVVATPLFYAASQRVAHEPSALAAVEATQAAEILFALVFEALWLGIPMPDGFAITGLVLILGGILLHSRPRSVRVAGAGEVEG